MSQGWIKLHRKFLKWEWWNKSEMVHLFIHFLLLANHKQNKWQGQTIYPGQFVTGLESLSEQTGISRQTLRTCINRLKSTGEITNISTNRFRLITIVNWEQYQVKDNELTSKLTGKLTNNQHTTNKQLTANKNDKKVKNEKKEVPLNKTTSGFRDLRRKQVGKQPMTPRKPTDKQKTSIEAFKGIEYFKKKGDDEGMIFLLDNDKRNKVLRNLTIEAYKKIGTLDKLIDWWFDGNGEWAEYEPEQCFSNKSIERFINKGKGKKNNFWKKR